MTATEQTQSFEGSDLELREQAREALNTARFFIQDSLTNGHLSGGDVGNLMGARDAIDQAASLISAAREGKGTRAQSHPFAAQESAVGEGEEGAVSCESRAASASPAAPMGERQAGGGEP